MAGVKDVKVVVDAPRRSEQIHAESDALFKQLDKNNDGKLSRKEIKNGLQTLEKDTGLKLQGKKAKDIFSYLDDDGGGEVRPDSQMVHVRRESLCESLCLLTRDARRFRPTADRQGRVLQVYPLGARAGGLRQALQTA